MVSIWLQKYKKNVCIAIIQTFFKGFKTKIKRFSLELGTFRGAREGNDVTDVLHAGDKQDEALEAESETSVGA